MKNEKDKPLVELTFQDGPQHIEQYYVYNKDGKRVQTKFKTKRNTTRYLQGERYEKQNVNNWERLGIDINRKGGKPPLEDFNDLED